MPIFIFKVEWDLISNLFAFSSFLMSYPCLLPFWASIFLNVGVSMEAGVFDVKRETEIQRDGKREGGDRERKWERDREREREINTEQER